MASSEQITVHVTFRQSKKLLTCMLSDLKQTIDISFQLSGASFLLQIWNADFADWVDLADIEELVGRDKFKLQVLLK